jgi:hypothetical protein
LVLDFLLPEHLPAPQPTIETGAAQAGFAPEKPKKTLKISKKPSAEPAAKPLPLPAPAPALAHPQATHQTRLNGQLVAYLLERSSNRRTVGFMVGEHGLRVRANARTSLAEIERLLQERADWILKHWQKQRDKTQAHTPEVWANGSSHGLHGQPITLQLCPDAKANQLQGSVLQLALPADASAAAIERAALNWYGEYAHAHFCQRLNHYAPAMGVQWRSLRLSSARTRWGSAKSDGSIRLHWRLVQLAPELLDYVVVHELAHLHEMNHSPRFWAIVAQHCPNYRPLRQRLKTQHLP